MTIRRGPGRRAAAAAILAILATVLLIPSAAARSGPYAHATTTGDAGCTGGQTSCAQWSAESPAEAPTWTFAADKSHVATGTAAAAHVSAAFTEVDDAQGMLGALTITGTVRAEITGAGTAHSSATFSADFLTRATTLQIVGTVTTDADGTDSIGSGSGAHVQLDCGSMDVASNASGGFGVPAAHDQQSLTREVPVLGEGGNGAGECSLNVSLIVGGGSDRGGAAAQHTSATADLSLSILAGPAPSPTTAGCALSGIITDGEITRDLHANPLADIPVGLRRDDAAIGDTVTTDSTGRYCIPEGVAEPGSYKLRATLADVRTDPPILETRYRTDVGPTWAEIPIVASDFGNQDVSFSFTATDDRQWLADVAAIHYQSQRYVDWLLDRLEVPPALFGPATIVAFDSGDTRFDERHSAVYIAARDSTYASRADPWVRGPAGLEWHELTHHLMSGLGIGAPDNCPLENPEGSWDNGSTCASMDEGFALFLPGLAVADLNPGPETLSFGFGGNLEDNGYYPWTRIFLRDHTVEREAFAVAQLLWDLTDDTPLEHAQVHAASLPEPFIATDSVAFDPGKLITVLASKQPNNIYELFALMGSAVPNEAIATHIDVNGDGSDDINLVDELLLIHGFHTVDNELVPTYSIGSTVGRTDHVPDPNAFLFERHAPLPLPGSAIRFTNPGSGPATFTVDITYPSTTSHFEVTVAPGQERLFEFEAPPYWQGRLPAGAGPPACGAAGQRTVTLTLAGGGTSPRTLDSCEYLRLASVSTSDAALTFGASASSLPGAVVPIVAGVGIVLVAGVLAGLLFVRRRRAA